MNLALLGNPRRKMTGTIMLLIAGGLAAAVWLLPGIDRPQAPPSPVRADEPGLDGITVVTNRSGLDDVSMLYLTLVRQADVVKYLRHNTHLSDGQRSMALKRADQERYSSRVLNQASWQIVREPGLDRTAYERAFTLAEEACRITPNNGAYLNTLGAAQYRIGRHGEAIATLQRSKALNAGTQPHADLAFLAMAHLRAGQKDEALAYYRQLRSAVEEGSSKLPETSELLGFLKEAEEVLGLAAKASK